MNRLASFTSKWWRPAASVLVLTAIVYLLFFRQLGSLLPGYTVQEQQAYHASSSLQAILHNPVNAPYKVVEYGLQAAGHHSLLTTRITAAIFSVITCGLFFILTRSWYGYRVGFLGTIMFATASGFLHVARFGSPLILQLMGLLLIIVCAIWFDRTKHAIPTRYLTALAAGLLLYIPGMLWFEIVVLFFVLPRIAAVGKDTPAIHRLLSSALLLVTLIPLIVAILRDSSLLLSLLALPSHMPDALAVLRHIGSNLAAIGIRSDGPASLWLGHLPLLTVTGLVLAIIGAVGFWRVNTRAAVYVLIACVACIVLSGLTGQFSASSLVPFLYLLVAGGIHMLLDQWFTVFPRNPIARYGGLALLCLTLAFSVLFHLRAYYIAWPHSLATRVAYHIERP